MKLNNKGFTLVEVLAVVVILSILIAIMVPNVNYLIKKNKEDNYLKLEEGILNAAKIYLSDNRYDIALDYGSELCALPSDEENVASINGVLLTSSRLPIRMLIDNKVLSTDADGNIENPRNTGEILDLEPEKSYVLIKYQCRSKDYKYILEENSLVWVKKDS